MKNNKIKDLINYYLTKKKLSIIDCGCHKGGFLKKVGFNRFKNGYLIDPLNYNLIQKYRLKKFQFFNVCLGNSNKYIIFNKYSNKYPEWSSVNSLGSSSIYKKKYSKYLNKKVEKKKIYQTTLDKLLKRKDEKFDILKIDCQSTSYEILKGTKTSLKKKRFKLIVVAINISEFYKNKSDNFIKITDFLNKFNYNLINIANSHTGNLGNLDYDYSNFKIWTFDAIYLRKM